MASKKSAAKSADGTRKVAAAAKKSVRKPKDPSLTINLPKAKEPLRAAGLLSAKVGMMLGVDLPNLSKTGWKALKDFLDAASDSVVVIRESCSYEPGSRKKKKP